MKEDFKFLTLTSPENREVSVYVKTEFNKPWVGKQVFEVENLKPSKKAVPDGEYTFSTGKVMDVQDGAVKSLKTREEMLLEKTNEKLDQLVEVLASFAKSVR